VDQWNRQQLYLSSLRIHHAGHIFIVVAFHNAERIYFDIWNKLFGGRHKSGKMLRGDIRKAILLNNAT